MIPHETERKKKQNKSKLKLKLSPIMGESPTLPGSLAVMPPVDVAAARLPLESIATAPTVSQPDGGGGADLKTPRHRPRHISE